MIYEFSASRVSGDGNAVFPDEIIIDDEEETLIYRKPRLIGCKESKVRFGAIGSVTIQKGILLPTFISRQGVAERLLPKGFHIVMLKVLLA